MDSADDDGCIWLALSSAPVAASLEEELRSQFRDTLETGDQIDPAATVGVVIADDGHRAQLSTARDQAGEALQSILLTADPSDGAGAEFVLPRDADLRTVSSVLAAAVEFRRHVISMRRDVAQRKSAVGMIRSGHFQLRNLDEARNLSTMLALACPNADLVAVGLQELLINAVEHGNLEIDAETKQSLLLEGGWREEVERRLSDPAFANRVVNIDFNRGERMINFVIQDEGPGFEHEAFSAPGEASGGYRGRGIALARELSFSSVRYMGLGNVVEATILLGDDDQADPGAA